MHLLKFALNIDSNTLSYFDDYHRPLSMGNQCVTAMIKTQCNRIRARILFFSGQQLPQSTYSSQVIFSR